MKTRASAPVERLDQPENAGDDLDIESLRIIAVIGVAQVPTTIPAVIAE